MPRADLHSFLSPSDRSSSARLSTAALVLSLTALTASCARQAPAARAPAPEAVRTIHSTAADIPLEFAAIGNVEAGSTVEVKARITAPVLKVHFAEGQDVRAGQLLFELDGEPVRRLMAGIEANIARDIALAKQAEANIARDQATWKNLESIANRSLQLMQQGIFSREQADQALTNAGAAKAAVQAGLAAVESAQAAERADRARLSEARLQLDYTRVLAPISGRAGVIATKQGSLARQYDNTLVTLLETAPVYVSFSLPEHLLPLVRKYQSQKPLTITALAENDRSSTGVLKFIDNAVDLTTGAIKLKALFANSDRLLWPGQFVNVSAHLSTEIGRVLVSSQAVQTGPGGKYVWVYNPAQSTVAMRDVVVARLYTPPGGVEMAVLDSGLKPGEPVVSEGQKRLAPGAKVRLLPSPAAAGN